MNSTVLLALESAIPAEIAAADLYARLSDKAGDAEARRVFLSLSADERRHRELLEKRYLDTVGQPYVAGNVPSILLPPDGDKMLWPAALTLAIKGEIAAHDGYLKSAAEAADAEGQAMYRQLAEDEAGHRRLLEAEYAARLGQPFAEYEMATWVRE